MSVSLNSKIAFTSNQPIPHRKDKDSEKKVVTGGGAVAATTAAARARGAKSGFSMFNSATNVSRGITTSAQIASNTAKRTQGLWAKVVENARWAKKAVLNWGATLQKSKFLKPLVNSKLFRFGAGTLGYGFGAVTMISGLSDITKVTTEAIEKQVNKNA